jgi:hypothetical protein
VRCSATSKRTGLPCGGYTMTGGYVCRIHGGASPAVRAAAARRWELAAARRWEFELKMRRIERRSGALVAAFMRAEFAPDPATYRSHKSAAERAAWTPRFIPVNLALAEEHGRAAG